MTMTITIHTLLLAISQALGWTYTLIWSVSLYPQLFHNYRRRATEGFSLDFALLNVLGLCGYTVFNGSLLFSSVIRAQYADRHPQSPEPPVHLNDFFYALHGAVICGLIYSQFQWPALWNIDRKGAQQMPGRVTMILLGVCFAIVVVDVLGVCYFPALGAGEWIDVIYLIGNIKLFLTIIKYTPQAWLNYRRQSTRGFCMVAILMDFTGGMLSLVQLFIDTALQNDWSGAAGNAPKLVLGNITILFDVILMVQHYCLYARTSRPETVRPVETDPLLGAEDGRVVRE